MYSTHVLLTPPTVSKHPSILTPAEWPAPSESQINPASLWNALPYLLPPKILLALQGPLKSTFYKRSFSITSHWKSILFLYDWLGRGLHRQPGTLTVSYTTTTSIKLCPLPAVWPWANHIYLDPSVPNYTTGTTIALPLQCQEGWIMQVKHLAKVIHLVTLNIYWLYHHHTNIIKLYFQIPCIS